MTGRTQSGSRDGNHYFQPDWSFEDWRNLVVGYIHPPTRHPSRIHHYSLICTDVQPNSACVCVCFCVSLPSFLCAHKSTMYTHIHTRTHSTSAPMFHPLLSPHVVFVKLSGLNPLLPPEMTTHFHKCNPFPCLREAVK